MGPVFVQKFTTYKKMILGIIIELILAILDSYKIKTICLKSSNILKIMKKRLR